MAIQTPADIYIFKCIEKKYVITKKQYNNLLTIISPHIILDRYWKSTVCSLYLDTPDFRLIRESMEAKSNSKVYKEKLRIRSYGTAKSQDKVFLEIKKKYKGVYTKGVFLFPIIRLMITFTRD